MGMVNLGTFAIKKEVLMYRREMCLSRARLLLGDAGMERLGGARVIIFGVGGVGSWCAESLVRSGVRHLTIVDPDVVCESNINRQIMATWGTVGRVKVEVMRERLLEINPEADIRAIRDVYCEGTAGEYDFLGYDFVVDAIDSLKDKALLILRACESGAGFVSSMGAALKTDISQVRLVEFWDAKGCPLARALRKRFKREGVRPARKFKCVFSPELRESGVGEPQGEGGKRVNGTLMHVTATFGLMLAGEVIRQLTIDK